MSRPSLHNSSPVILLSVTQRMHGNLDPDDWQIALAVFGAIRSAIPNANERPPGEVMEFVLNAIHAASAKTIEGESK